MSTTTHSTIEGEASESDDEQNNIQAKIFSSYGTAVDGEASESENEDSSINEKEISTDQTTNDENTNPDILSPNTIKYFKGIELDKIWFLLNEFKYSIWDNMKISLENKLLSSNKELKNTDKLLLKSQMTLQSVSYNLQTSHINVLKLSKIIERIKTTKYIPKIKL